MPSFDTGRPGALTLPRPHRVIDGFMLQLGCPHSVDPRSSKAGTGAPKPGSDFVLRGAGGDHLPPHTHTVLSCCPCPCPPRTMFPDSSASARCRHAEEKKVMTRDAAAGTIPDEHVWPRSNTKGEQSRAEQGRAGQGRAGQSRAEQSRAEQSSIVSRVHIGAMLTELPASNAFRHAVDGEHREPGHRRLAVLCQPGPPPPSTHPCPPLRRCSLNSAPRCSTHQADNSFLDWFDSSGGSAAHVVFGELLSPGTRPCSCAPACVRNSNRA